MKKLIFIVEITDTKLLEDYKDIDESVLQDNFCYNPKRFFSNGVIVDCIKEE
jgi:hypothetical protein